MCGICVIAVPAESADKCRMCELRNAESASESAVSHVDLLLEPILRRGPNQHGTVQCELNGGAHVHIAGSVLHMRGKLMTKQPASDAFGNVLAWNGNVFGKLEIDDLVESDTSKVLHLLSQAENDADVLSTFQKLDGPFAFAYLQKNENKIWFGRDWLGRRSLLWNIPQKSGQHFILSSVAIERQEDFSSCCQVNDEREWVEVPVGFIFHVTFDSGLWNITKYPRLEYVSKQGIHCQPKSRLPEEQLRDEHGECLVDIDCENDSYKKDSASANIKFGRYGMKPKVAALSKQIGQCHIVNAEAESLAAAVDNMMLDTAQEFVAVLSKAVEKRVLKQPGYCNNCTRTCSHAKVAILFSGGIDSMVLAILADRHVLPSEPIDLINIAFEQADSNFNVPDRRTAIDGLSELEQAKPERKWNLIYIDVTVSELKSRRSDRIQNLVFPLNTVLDDSIGCALWFAARGQGMVNRVPQESSARVVLVGIGADEQLGGYSRHRTRFSADGYEGLARELRLEMHRISERNLGRDDRVISDHGKEARFPFLDEDVISYLNKLPIRSKLELTMRRGYGEKILLRVAADMLGLKNASTLPKRAIQFGSRIAKIEGGVREKGSQKCSRLQRV